MSSIIENRESILQATGVLIALLILNYLLSRIVSKKVK